MVPPLARNRMRLAGPRLCGLGSGCLEGQDGVSTPRQGGTPVQLSLVGAGVSRRDGVSSGRFASGEMNNFAQLVRTTLPSSVRAETDQGPLPRLSIRTATAEADVYFQGAQVTGWRPGVQSGTGPLAQPPKPVRTGSGDPRRGAHLLPVVQQAPDRPLGAAPRLRANARLDPGDGAARRRRHRHARDGAGGRGDRAPVASPVPRAAPDHHRCRPPPGSRGAEHRPRDLRLRGSAPRLLRCRRHPRGDRVGPQIPSRFASPA